MRRHLLINKMLRIVRDGQSRCVQTVRSLPNGHPGWAHLFTALSAFWIPRNLTALHTVHPSRTPQRHGFDAVPCRLGMARSLPSPADAARDMHKPCHQGLNLIYAPACYKVPADFSSNHLTFIGTSAYSHDSRQNLLIASKLEAARY